MLVLSGRAPRIDSRQDDLDRRGYLSLLSSDGQFCVPQLLLSGSTLPADGEADVALWNKGIAEHC